ncbi:MAG: hypothetical protein A2622_10570 [Bdellovibrionales bacterium RIFCSPHIGHO2_01_FULL_40_29]|nr:MAG: hypothetical protein A2622_10570 [Bdellovibrionales bacterium RIFCSPHIGHO2_01_FULL_40_29]OFZ34403.1 MAG: hypothetical protein A3D17_00835 [Bdellovibrionales bacterium RIFCSPHIGHO2_02_FULL_40_15]
MKKITVTAVLLSLCFATGFTCSKNAPQQEAAPTEAAAPAEMAAPTEGAPVAAPTEAPATETK